MIHGAGFAKDNISYSDVILLKSMLKVEFDEARCVRFIAGLNEISKDLSRVGYQIGGDRKIYRFAGVKHVQEGDSILFISH